MSHALLQRFGRQARNYEAPGNDDAEAWRFRRGRESDLAALQRAEQACFAQSPWRTSFLQWCLSSSEVYVDMAETSRENAGMELAGWAVWGENADCDAYLLSVAVLEQYRGRGLGRLLLQRGLAALHVAGYSRLLLNVGVENTAAKALYLQTGFQRIYRVDRHFWSNMGEQEFWEYRFK